MDLPDPFPEGSDSAQQKATKLKWSHEGWVDVFESVGLVVVLLTFCGLFIRLRQFLCPADLSQQRYKRVPLNEFEMSEVDGHPMESDNSNIDSEFGLLAEEVADTELGKVHSEL